jgi:hypothetical protein
VAAAAAMRSLPRDVASFTGRARQLERLAESALAIGGYAGMIVFALVAALGLAFLSGTPRLVIIMIGLDFFIASFAIGVGGVGWTLQGEVFPTAVRGQAAAFAALSSTSSTAKQRGWTKEAGVSGAGTPAVS